MGEEGAYRYYDDDATTTIGSSLIPIINKLHGILAPVGGELKKISLPQVAVVGSQSSGKSSVLEALVGLDFLPRGTEICTRRPLALMLENRPYDNADGAAEWGEFRHLPGKRFYDFSKIRQEIQAETEKAAGSNKGVSDKQIGLKISSPNVLNMTLIDLPGITKVPVGDQPSDIEARIRRIIMAYISQQNSIILAVTPANCDLTNSDALQMAREADPTGSRTIGVITKLDIMDRGTNACNFLLGKVVPLRLGYIGVINRSQEDIDSNRTIQEALAREERFFSDHPVYNSLSDRCGIPQLAKILNQILEQHIKTALPNLKADLNSRMVAVVKELQTYGELAQSKAEQGMILLKSLTRYREAFMAMVNGESQEMSTKELSGGARIHYIFQSIFVKSLEVVDPCEDLTDDDIRTAIQNANGPTNALFVPEVPFAVLVRRQIMRLLDPSLQCLIYVYDELIKMSCACVSPELQRFPNLSKRLLEVMGKILRDGLRHAEGVIASLIDMEMDYINSSHPNFIGGKKAVEQAMEQFRPSQGIGDFEKKPPNEDQRHRATVAKSLVKGVASNQGIHCQLDNERPVSTGSNMSTRSWGISSLFGSRASSMENPRSRSAIETLNDAEQSSSAILLREPPSVIRPVEMTEREAVEIIVTKSLLQSYYDIVRKNIQDLVPKAIMHFLVNHAKRNLHDTFIQKLYRENLFEELLQEQGEVVAKRKHAREIFHVLLQAVQALDEIDSDVSSRCSNSSSALGGGTATTVLSSSAGGSLHLQSGRVGGNSLPYLSSTQKAKALGLYYSDE